MPLNKEIKPNSAQSAGALEYTECLSADGWDFPN